MVKPSNPGVRDIAQLFSALAALAEDLFVPQHSGYAAYNCPLLQLLGFNALFWLLQVLAHNMHIYTDICAHLKKNKINLKTNVESRIRRQLES